MKKLSLFLLPLLMLIGACSLNGVVDSKPFVLRFVVEDEEGSPITEDVSVTYMENGEEILIEDLEIETYQSLYQKDTFATHWESLYMPVYASSGRVETFYLKYDGAVDTLTLIYKEKDDMDYQLFLQNGKEIKRDMSRLWPHNYITINKK